MKVFTPEHLRNVAARIFAGCGSPEGGLAVRAWAIPDVPLENLEAFCTAAEAFCLPR